MEDFIEVLSIKRHDLLNHIQVISGYLQLNKIDRAKEHLIEMVNELNRESLLLNCKSGKVAVALLCLQHKALLAGVKLSVKLGGALENSPVLEETLTRIIEVYGLTLQQVPPTSKQVNIETCLLEASEQEENIVWKFEIPSRQNSQKFQDQVRFILKEVGVLPSWTIYPIDRGLHLVISKE